MVNETAVDRSVCNEAPHW